MKIVWIIPKKVLVIWKKEGIMHGRWDGGHIILDFRIGGSKVIRTEEQTEKLQSCKVTKADPASSSAVAKEAVSQLWFQC